jgi:hypothetical protein
MGRLGSSQRDVNELRAMAYQTKSVITTNGKRYALVIHGDGTIEVCADMLHAPPFCAVGNLADALDAIRWHSGGDIKDLY